MILMKGQPRRAIIHSANGLNGTVMDLVEQFGRDHERWADVAHRAERERLALARQIVAPIQAARARIERWRGWDFQLIAVIPEGNAQHVPVGVPSGCGPVEERSKRRVRPINTPNLDNN